MNNSESILVIVSFIFSLALYCVVLIKGNRPSLLYKGITFDKSKVTVFTKFMTLVFVASLFTGWVITREISLILGFTGINLFMAAVMGLNIFLYHRPESRK